MNISISKRSQELIDNYWATTIPKSPAANNITLEELLFFLSEPISADKPAKDNQLPLMTLRAELLHDLCSKLEGNTIKPVKLEEKKSKLKLIFFTLAGILVAACEGFDSVVTIMGIFSVSPLLILGFALAFSFLSIMAYRSLDLIKLSNRLGIKFNDTHQLLDAYLQQLDEIKNIRKKITRYNLSNCSLEELKDYEQMIAALKQSLERLAKTGEQFDAVLNSAQMKAIKLILSSVTAALFFGGSFCAGQTVAIFIFSFFMTAITPASLPVLLFSTLVGLAAFSLYWHVEFPGLKKLVTSWFGLDRDKIDKLCNQDLLDKEKQKLEQLHERIVGVSELKEQIPLHQQKIDLSKEKKPTPSPTLIGENIYSFMKPALQTLITDNESNTPARTVGWVATQHQGQT